MVKRTTYGRSHDSDFETVDEDITGHHVALYKFGRSAETDYPPHEPAPLFLSGHDDEPDPGEFTNLLRKRRPSVASCILASVLVASAVAILFALFSSDDMRNIVVDAKVSIAAMLPAPSVAEHPDSVQLTAEDIELLKDPARLSRPVNQTPGVRSVTTVAPSREEITSAYQSAARSQVPAAVAPAEAATNELSDAEEEELFKQFMAWKVERNAQAHAQVRPKKAKRLPPMVRPTTSADRGPHLGSSGK